MYVVVRKRERYCGLFRRALEKGEEPVSSSLDPFFPLRVFVWGSLLPLGRWRLSGGAGS